MRQHGSHTIWCGLSQHTQSSHWQQKDFPIPYSPTLPVQDVWKSTSGRHTVYSWATHVYDKFHVVELVNEAVNQVRRSVWNQEKNMEKRKLIKGTRWMLLSKSLDKFDEASRRRFTNILTTNEPPPVQGILLKRRHRTDMDAKQQGGG